MTPTETAARIGAFLQDAGPALVELLAAKNGPARAVALIKADLAALKAGRSLVDAEIAKLPRRAPR